MPCSSSPRRRPTRRGVRHKRRHPHHSPVQGSQARRRRLLEKQKDMIKVILLRPRSRNTSRHGSRTCARPWRRTEDQDERQTFRNSKRVYSVYPVCPVYPVKKRLKRIAEIASAILFSFPVPWTLYFCPNSPCRSTRPSRATTSPGQAPSAHIHREASRSLFTHLTPRNCG